MYEYITYDIISCYESKCSQKDSIILGNISTEWTSANNVYVICLQKKNERLCFEWMYTTLFILIHAIIWTYSQHVVSEVYVKKRPGLNFVKCNLTNW